MEVGGRVWKENTKTLAPYSGSVFLCVIVHSFFHLCWCTEMLS